VLRDNAAELFGVGLPYWLALGSVHLHLVVQWRPVKKSLARVRATLAKLVRGHDGEPGAHAALRLELAAELSEVRS
jgi:hypothetical protein